MRLDEDELVRWGRRIGASIATPVLIALEGPLGAGKSVLARAIGAGAGVVAAMPSPTYNLFFRYPTPSGRQVVHVDLYRLTDPPEVWELGWSELGASDEIALVEWPERAGPYLPESHWRVELVVPADRPGVRDVRVSRVGTPPDLPGFPASADTSAR